MKTHKNFFFLIFLGSLLDFLKSETGSRLLLPKLIDFSAQVSFTPSATCRSFKHYTIVKYQQRHCKGRKGKKKCRTHSSVGESHQAFGIGDYIILAVLFPDLGSWTRERSTFIIKNILIYCMLISIYYYVILISAKIHWLQLYSRSDSYLKD